MQAQPMSGGAAALKQIVESNTPIDEALFRRLLLTAMVEQQMALEGLRVAMAAMEVRVNEKLADMEAKQRAELSAMEARVNTKLADLEAKQRINWPKTVAAAITAVFSLAGAIGLVALTTRP